MTPKFLILDCSNENESLFTVILWDDCVADTIVQRLTLAKEMHEKDCAFSTNAYSHASALYDGCPDEILSEDDASQFENSGWAAVAELPPMDGFDQLRLNDSEMSVSYLGYFWWTLSIKHDQTRTETNSLSPKEEGIRKLLRIQHG